MAVTTSVVICAYTEKRWDQLVAAVESVQAQDEPVGQIVLVIDHHDELLRKASERWPKLTVVANSGPQGLAGARNTVDGVQVWRVTGRHVPDEPMYVVLNLAVGGVYPGPPESDTQFPATFAIDYLRITGLR